MKKALCLFIILVFGLGISTAQSDRKIALTINGKPVYKDELQQKFDSRPIDANDKKESLDEFIEGYVYKKMVLEEAKAERMDTLASYQRELTSYNYQLTNSYITDTTSYTTLAAEILKRFEYELDVNHAFIPFPEDALFSKDTVQIFQYAEEAHNTAINQGFDHVKETMQMNTFGVMLSAETESGHLGWVRPMMFSPELDNVLYSLKLNEVSAPIRTVGGYHILQVVGKRKLQGNPVVEQVMFNFHQIPATQATQDSVYNVAMRVYNEIAVKGNFQVICDEYAQAYDMGDKGCLFGEVSYGVQMPSVLINAAFALKEIGEVSKPILTDYGYHILRLKEKYPAPTQAQLTQAVDASLKGGKSSSQLAVKGRQKLLADFNAKINHRVYNELAHLTDVALPHDAEFMDQVKEDDRQKVLLNINGVKDCTVGNLLEYIDAKSWMYKNQIEEGEMVPMVRVELMVKPRLSIDLLQSYFEGFVSTELLRYAKATLADRVPQYKTGMDEITDGLLYTTLMEEKIWNKIVADADGLQATFLKNREKYALDGEAFKGSVIMSKNEQVLSEIEANFANKEVPAKRDLQTKYNGQKLTIQIAEGLWKEGENPYVDSKIFETKERRGTKGFPYYTVLGKFISAPQDYADVRADVERDYRADLEGALKSLLENKYKVELNQSVIKEIK